MTKEEIQELNERLQEVKDKKEAIENNEQEYEDRYDEMIDEQGTVKIGSLEYTASHVLEQIDPIAYNLGYNEYFDEQLSECENEITEIETELKEVSK